MSLVSTDWKTISKKQLIKTPFVELWEDHVLRPNGTTTHYYYYHKTPFSIVIPITDHQKLVLVRQYRYTVSSLTLEFPMGYVANKKPREIAEIELRQETGITALSLKEIGKFHLAPGHTNQMAYVFLAENLTFGKPEPEEGEFLEMEEYTIEQVRKMIDNGTILDGPTIVAYHFLERYLKGESS